jgi:hypothetical protein
MFTFNARGRERVLPLKSGTRLRGYCGEDPVPAVA